jgi:beta-glucanase (GH16 family)
MILRHMRSNLAVLVSAALAVAAYGQIKNPGFETGSGAQASSWTTFGNAFREASGARTGSFGLKLFGGFNGGTSVSGAFQRIEIAPGSRVYASCWAINRSSDAMSGDNFAVLKLVYFDKGGNEIEAKESRPIRGNTFKDRYHLISASLGPSPKAAVVCNIYLLFIQPASTPFASGSVTFDDIAVTIEATNPNKLVWNDEFSGKGLDLNKWEPMIGDGTAYGIPGWGNNELQFYTGRPDNVVVEEGFLRIRARRENYGGKQFTSARLRTLNKYEFRYGRIEARIQVPAGQGLWPACWMLPSNSPYGTWASSGEIDIMEMVNAADRVHGTVHFGDVWPGQQSNGGSRSISSGFHTYIVDWRPDEIVWSVDGVEYHRVTSMEWWSRVGFWNQRAPFDTPFHLLLNVAVGGNWPGAPNQFTQFPAEMLVDYVRVYQYVPKLDISRSR